MKTEDLFMVCYFGGGGSYQAPAPAAVPTEDSPEMKQAADEAAKREATLARKKKGRLSTILTNPWGLTNEPQLSSGTLTAGKTRLGQ